MKEKLNTAFEFMGVILLIKIKLYKILFLSIIVSSYVVMLYLTAPTEKIMVSLISISLISILLIKYNNNENLIDKLEFEGYLYIDKKFDITACNQKILDIFKYTKQEMLNSSILDLIHENYLTIFNDLIMKEEVYAQEIVGIDSNNNEIDLIITFEIEKDTEKIYFIERDRADFILSRLTTSTSYYYAFSRVSGIALIIRDLADIYTEFDNLKNKGIINLVEYLEDNPEELIRINKIDKISHISDGALKLFEADNIAQLTMELQGGYNLQYKESVKILDEIYNNLIIKDKKMVIRTFKNNEKTILLRTNQPSKHNPKLILLLIDITAQTWREEQIKKANMKYEVLFSKAPIGIFTVFTNVIMLANDKLAEMFGYERKEELIGLRIEKLQPVEYQEEYALRNRKKIEKRLIEDRFRSFGKKKDGDIIEIEISSTFVEVDDEKFELVFVRNITEEVSLAKEKDKILVEIMEAKRLEAMSLLAGGIVHDFNNLLLGIAGGIELISLNDDLNEDTRATIDIIDKAATQATNLTRSLMAYTGRQVLFQENIKIAELIENMKGLIKLSVSDKIVLKYDMKSTSETVYLSKIQLQQVILNTVINASDAIQDNGSISMRSGCIKITDALKNKENMMMKNNLKSDKKYIFIAITDTGSGIQSDDLQKIFDPFYSTKDEGKGLGLSVVIGIIKQSHGAIHIESEIDKGTTITYYLPTSPDRPRLVMPVIEEQKIYGFNGTVLIIDDEEIVLNILNRYMHKIGFQVDTALNGRDAVVKFKNQPDKYDLIFLDLTMPEMSGYEVFNEIVKIRKDIPIIVISGYADIDMSVFREHEYFDFILKPFTIDTVVSKLRNVLSNF